MTTSFQIIDGPSKFDLMMSFFNTEKGRFHWITFETQNWPEVHDAIFGTKVFKDIKTFRAFIVSIARDMETEEGLYDIVAYMDAPLGNLKKIHGTFSVKSRIGQFEPV